MKIRKYEERIKYRKNNIIFKIIGPVADSAATGFSIVILLDKRRFNINRYLKGFVNTL